MNVFQRSDALQSLLDAHAAGTISNANLDQGTKMICALFDQQPKAARTYHHADVPRLVPAKVVDVRECLMGTWRMRANVAYMMEVRAEYIAMGYTVTVRGVVRDTRYIMQLVVLE